MEEMATVDDVPQDVIFDGKVVAGAAWEVPNRRVVGEPDDVEKDSGNHQQQPSQSRWPPVNQP
jgi:hypothetical protein